MHVSEEWLRSWVNPSLDREALAAVLTMAGIEVESISPICPEFHQVVVAEIKAIAPHEQANRLQVVQVDIGSDRLLQIVCGAPNVALGLKVPCALPGALLPGKIQIESRRLRGVESNGMLCSAKELGLPDEQEGLLRLPTEAPVGLAIRDTLVLDDAVFSLKITPNRADCLSIRGLAREIVALTGATLCPVPIIPVTAHTQETLPISITTSGCGRYVGRVIDGVNAAAATPLWIKRRLERAKIRSVSAIVDITNYVLLEQGQPLHAFDRATLQGGIQVRMAHPGELFVGLNGVTVTLDASFMVIADAEKVLAIAGIMGSKESSVTEATQSIFLESAFFTPEAVAAKSPKLKFSSDSLYRYERGVDSQLQHAALERATQLILDICGGHPGPPREIEGVLPCQKGVRVRCDRVNRVLGTSLSVQTIGAIFQRLGFESIPCFDGFVVTPPSFRFDLAIEEDFIEEVARLHGYETIAADPPLTSFTMLAQPQGQLPRSLIRRKVALRDYQEVVTYSFVDESWERDFAANHEPIQVLNPIAEHLSVMRSTLIGSLLKVLLDNVNRKQPRVRLFEIARVFGKEALTCTQTEKLAALAWGLRVPEQWDVKNAPVDFFDVKGDLEALFAPQKPVFKPARHPAMHPGRCAQIVLAGHAVGYMGQLHPQWLQTLSLASAPILFEVDLSAVQNTATVTLHPVSKFQMVRRDLALFVDDATPITTLLDTLEQVSNEIIIDIALFDLYRGAGVPDGKKSVAFSVSMQSQTKTLTDKDVEEALNQLISAVSEHHQAHLRT